VDYRLPLFCRNVLFSALKIQERILEKEIGGCALRFPSTTSVSAYDALCGAQA
jgi:hypothetical protein